MINIELTGRSHSPRRISRWKMNDWFHHTPILLPSGNPIDRTCLDIPCVIFLTPDTRADFMKHHIKRANAVIRSLKYFGKTQQVSWYIYYLFIELINNYLVLFILYDISKVDLLNNQLFKIINYINFTIIKNCFSHNYWFIY